MGFHSKGGLERDPHVTRCDLSRAVSMRDDRGFDVEAPKVLLGVHLIVASCGADMNGVLQIQMMEDGAEHDHHRLNSIREIGMIFDR